MKEKELQTFALVVHGFLAFGHALGLVYNARRGNKVDAVVHSLALCYDLNRAHKHYKAIEEATHDRL